MWIIVSSLKFKIGLGCVKKTATVNTGEDYFTLIS